MKRTTKIIITFGLFLALQLFVTGMAFRLSAEATVTRAYTNGVIVTAVDTCSDFAKERGWHYIEFCGYKFKPLDNVHNNYYIILLNNTYYVTTDSKVYTATLASIENNTYTKKFQDMAENYITCSPSWNVLGYLENNTIFGWTFIPNKNLTTFCKKNKTNRYFFGGNK